MNKEYTSEFIFKDIQIKSIEKAKLFAKLVDTMEKEFGIKTCKITIEDSFICPDITTEELRTLNNGQMEENIRNIMEQLI